MNEFLNNLYEYIESLILAMGYFGPILASLIIIVESILPVLPLCLFIALNCLILGNILGIIISYLFTIVGCYLSFIMVRKGLKKFFDRKLRDKKKIKKVMSFTNKADLVKLSIIMAIPFAPAFLINICAALSDNVSKKTFICSLLIGKIFMVYFWGFIGTSLVESFRNPYILIKVAIMVLLAYLISHYMNKWLGVK